MAGAKEFLNQAFMKITLLHATARPEAAKKCQKLWLDMADNSANIEIITCVDADDEASKQAFPDAVLSYGVGVCPAWNEAAKHATGDVFIVIDDDFEPPPSYDQIVESYMCNGADILHVGDKHRKDQLMCHPIFSKKYYDAIGYVWHPSFKSICCDDWFTTMAKSWGYVDATQGGKVDLGFLHAHVSQGYGHEDEVARISNSKERYTHGKALYERLLTNNVVLAFTAYNRPEYLKESLDSWLKNDLSLVTSVQFFIEPSDRLPEILAVIDDFAKQSIAPVIKHVNPEKYGVLRNPWELFRNLFEYQLATFVILGEDDFIASPDTLAFFEKTRFQMRPKTLAICAKNVGEGSNNDPSTFTYDEGFSGNVWGLYADKWKGFLRDTWDFDYSSGKADNSPSGWDHNIGSRVMPKNGLKCLVPTASRSWHIGVQGCHTTPEGYNETVTWNFVRDEYKGSYEEKFIDNIG